MSDSLRETSTPAGRLPATPLVRRKRQPLELFTDYAVAARLWFIVALVATAYAVVAPYLVIRAQRVRERVVILDGAGTYHLSPLLGFEEAGKLHETHAVLACLALWSRNPAGFDHPELLEKLFLPEALQRARGEASRTAEEFAAKSLHQKPEVLKLTVLETREDLVLVQVEGQLVRTGLLQGRPFTEAPAFTAQFTFARNPDLARNGRYPLAVWKYDVSS